MPSLMKGHVWVDRKDARDRQGNPVVNYPVLVEDKHDEIRCHAIAGEGKVGFLSYAGKPLANMQRFERMFSMMADTSGHTEFDVGFEVNGNFNDSYRWVRSTRGVPTDLAEATFKFFLFGFPAYGHTLSHHRELAVHLVGMGYRDWEYPVRVPHATVAYSEQQVNEAFLDARARGLEGVMVKQLAKPYERKRTDGWLKMKPEADADGIIVGFEEGVCGVDQPAKGLRVGDPLERITSVLVWCEDGSQAAPHGISHELGRDMFLHPEKYIGQWCEFKYMERDRQGGYRHPTFHRLREDTV